LLEDTRTVAEGFGADGCGSPRQPLMARGSQVGIPADNLAHSDESIRQHPERMNRGCAERIVLCYF